VSPYSDEFGGCVLNATVNLFSYCFLTPYTESKIEFYATDRDESYCGDALPELPLTGDLLLHKVVYNRIVKQFNDGKPLPCRLVTYSDAPAGSGLGTSSTMVVAIIGAFIEWLRLPLGEYEIARLAYELERVDLAFPGGKQDQYAAAFGGFNFMEFLPENRVIVNPLRIKSSIANELQSNLVLYFTGASRESATIIKEQIKNVVDRAQGPLDAMHQVKKDALLLKEHLLRGDIHQFALAMGSSWQFKKRMSAVVSNDAIERILATAVEAGAIAGKVSGAGGGGFIMFMAEPIHREGLVRALRALGGQTYFPQFTTVGLETWKIPSSGQRRNPAWVRREGDG
jgi:D-glycero-alpha-D-manno-heptose-7-phosphate kinase